MVTKNMKVRPGDYFNLKKEDLNLSADLRNLCGRHYHLSGSPRGKCLWLPSPLSSTAVTLKAWRPWQRCHAKSNHQLCFATKQLSAPGGPR